MKQVTINLYSFSELSNKSKEKAILNHQVFLTQQGEPSGRNTAIEAIKINDYLFFEDGEFAHCTTYTGNHPKSGITEFHFHSRTFDVTK